MNVIDQVFSLFLEKGQGAYFGEVLRRQMRGFWRAPSASLHDFQVCSSVAFVAINPFGVAYDAYKKDVPALIPRLW